MGSFAQTPVGGGTSSDRIVQRIPTLASFKQKVSSASSALAGSSRTRDWGVFDVELNINPRDTDWVDEITVPFYVMMKARSNTKDKALIQQPFSFFKLTNKYRDLEKGRRSVSAIMLPTAMARFGDVIGLAVEVSMDGKVIHGDSIEGGTDLPKPTADKKWWTDTGIIDSEKTAKRTGYLVARSQTPYVIVKPDDFEVEVESK